MSEQDAAERAVEETKQWVEEVVVGLGFCPFAESVRADEAIWYVGEPADQPYEVLDAVVDEAERLLEEDPEEVATTLLITPNALEDFGLFLGVVETAREMFARAGLEGVLQIATFHPDYQFEGTDPDEKSNYTNRSPYPTIHLLRERQISEAVDSHPDPEGIPERNIALLEGMERREIEEIWASFRPDDT